MIDLDAIRERDRTGFGHRSQVEADRRALLSHIYELAKQRAQDAERIRRLTVSLQEMVDLYVQLVNCGDCGNWDPETESQVRRARAALGDGQPQD